MLDECTLQIECPPAAGVTPESVDGWSDDERVYDLIGNLFNDSPRLPPVEI